MVDYSCSRPLNSSWTTPSRVGIIDFDQWEPFLRHTENKKSKDDHLPGQLNKRNAAQIHSAIVFQIRYTQIITAQERILKSSVYSGFS